MSGMRVTERRGQRFFDERVPTLDLSIVIVSYNTAALLRDCLRSIERAIQIANVEAETWVVDNASSDRSESMVAEEFPWVRLIENERNFGFSAANNQALRLAMGRYLLVLNPDTELLGDAISPLMAYLEANPHVAMVTSSLVNGDGSFQHSAFRFPGLWQAFLDLFPVHPRMMESTLNGRYPKEAYKRPFEIDHPLGACMLLRRDAIEEVGPLSEDYFLYCEEIDWSLRLKAAGWRIVCVPEAKVLHHAGAATRQDRPTSFVRLYRSRFTLYERYQPFWKRVGFRLIVTAGMLKEWLTPTRELTDAQRVAWRAACREVLGMALGRR
jgi:GT2 family glycosyltransferase